MKLILEPMVVAAMLMKAVPASDQTSCPSEQMCSAAPDTTASTSHLNIRKHQ